MLTGTDRINLIPGLRLVTIVVLFVMLLLASQAQAAGQPYRADPASLGLIPDGTSGTCANFGAPREVIFNVTGLTSAVEDVRVKFRLGPVAHGWVGDLDVVLTSPDNRSHVIFSRTGASTTTGAGGSANVEGPYEFSDAAPEEPTWWSTAQGTNAGLSIPSGSYRSSMPGGPNEDRGTNTLITPVFAEAAEPLNGTWKLAFRDGCGTDISSVVAATLTIDDGTQIYDNGGFATGSVAGSGVVAPSLSEWSELQHDAPDTSAATASLGFNVSSGFRLADDFTVPAHQHWTINSVETYGYGTNYVGDASPFTTANLRIWQGKPGEEGSTIVFGDTETNNLINSGPTDIYRINSSVVPPLGSAPGTTRHIFSNLLNVDPPLSLSGGTYWIDWRATVSTPTAFAPTVTILGQMNHPDWNGMQLLPGEEWVTVVPSGHPAANPSLRADFPFNLRGETADLGGASLVIQGKPKVKPKKVKAGKAVTLTVKVANRGDTAAEQALVCVKLSKKLKKAFKGKGKPAGCKKAGLLEPGQSKTVKLKLKTKKKGLKPGKKYKLKLRATGRDAVFSVAVATLKTATVKVAKR